MYDEQTSEVFSSHSLDPFNQINVIKREFKGPVPSPPLLNNLEKIVREVKKSHTQKKVCSHTCLQKFKLKLSIWYKVTERKGLHDSLI